MNRIIVLLAAFAFLSVSLASGQSTMTIHTTTGNATFNLTDIDSITFSVGEAPPESTALVAYYPFNGNANDSTATANNGILHGGTWVADRFGNPGAALLLNGQSDFVEIPDNAVLRPTAVSVTMWVNVNAFSSLKTGGNTNSQYILLKKNSRAFSWNAYDFEMGDVVYIFEDVVASAQGAQVFARSAQGSVELGHWYQLAMTADQNELKLYVNGFLVAEAATGFPLDYSTIPTPLTIGSSMDPWNGFFNGAVDDLRIYSGILTADQILATYSLSKTRAPGGEGSRRAIGK